MSLPFKSFMLGINNLIEINVEEINIDFELNYNFEFFDYSNFEYKSNLLKDITNDLLFQIKLSENPTLNKTYFSQTIQYLINNMKVKIKKINIRLFNNLKDHFGINCDEISFDNKNMKINNLYIFFNNKYDYIIYPINMNLSLEYTEKKYEINVEINEIKFKINKQQYNIIIFYINFFMNYKNFYRNCYDLRKIFYNKPKEKNIKLLKHYIKSFVYFIKEKKYNLILFEYDKNLEKHKKIFCNSFKDYYYNNIINDDLKNIIKYTEKNILINWIKEDINNIYNYNNINKGFFGGLKSYFYTNTIKNIKLTQDMKQNNYDFQINFNIKFLIFILNSQFQEIKFIIKNINHLFNFEMNKINYELFLNKIKLTFNNKINKSEFVSDIITTINENNILKQNNEIYINYTNELDKKNLKIDCTSHNIYYSQNMFSFCKNFFKSIEIKDIEKKYKYNEILENINKYQFKNSNDINLDIKIANHRLIFPYKKTLNEDKLVINLGDLYVKSLNFYDFLTNNISIYYENEITKINLINNFSFQILSTFDCKQIETKISEIDCKIDNIVFENILKYSQEIFTLNSTKDIWNTIIKNKANIFNNSIKRGNLLLKINNKWLKFYSLLSGGFIYLFENSSNEKAKYLINLCNSKIEENIIKEEGLYIIKINLSNKKNYKISHTNEKDILLWKEKIKERINEIQKSLEDNKEIKEENNNFLNNLVEDSERIRRGIKNIQNNTLTTIKKNKEFINDLKEIIDNNYYFRKLSFDFKKINFHFYDLENSISFIINNSFIEAKFTNFFNKIKFNLGKINLFINKINFLENISENNNLILSETIIYLDDKLKFLYENKKILEKICKQQLILDYINSIKKFNINLLQENNIIFNIKNELNPLTIFKKIFYKFYNSYYNVFSKNLNELDNNNLSSLSLNKLLFENKIDNYIKEIQFNYFDNQKYILLNFYKNSYNINKCKFYNYSFSLYKKFPFNSNEYLENNNDLYKLKNNNLYYQYSIKINKINIDLFLKTFSFFCEMNNMQIFIEKYLYNFILNYSIDNYILKDDKINLIQCVKQNEKDLSIYYNYNIDNKVILLDLFMNNLILNLNFEYFLEFLNYLNYYINCLYTNNVSNNNSLYYNNYVLEINFMIENVVLKTIIENIIFYINWNNFMFLKYNNNEYDINYQINSLDIYSKEIIKNGNFILNEKIYDNLNNNKKYILQNFNSLLNLKFKYNSINNIFEYELYINNQENIKIYLDFQDINSIFLLLKQYLFCFKKKQKYQRNVNNINFFDEKNVNKKYKYIFKLFFKNKHISIEIKKYFLFLFENFNIVLNNLTELGSDVKIKIKYYNEDFSLYELFIEQLNIILNINEKKFNFIIEDDFNINITENLLKLINRILDLYKMKLKEIKLLEDKRNSKIIYNYTNEDFTINNNYVLKIGECLNINLLNIKTLKFNQSDITYNNFNLEKISSNINNNINFNKNKNKYYFFSTYLIISNCNKEIKLKIQNKIYLLKKDYVIGVSSENHLIDVYINENKKISFKITDIIKYTNNSINFDCLTLKIEEYKIKNKSFLKIYIFPNIIVHNCINYPFIIYSLNDNKKFYLNSCNFEELFIKLENFKNIQLIINYLNKENYSEKINIKLKEKEKFLIYFDFLKIKIKLRYLKDSNNIYNFYLYIDKFLINNTNYKITLNNPNLEFNDNKYLVNYYSLNNFNLIDFQIEINNKIFKIEKFSIEKKDYAFFKKIEISQNDKIIVKLLIQRHIRYIQFNGMIYTINLIFISLIDNNEILKKTNDKIISIYKNNINKEKNKKFIYQIILNIQNINISVFSKSIENNNVINREMFLINLNKTIFNFTSEYLFVGEKNLQNNLNSVKLIITSIQIDNMTNNAIYKVVFFNKKESKLFFTNSEDEKKLKKNNKSLIPFIQFKTNYIKHEFKYYLFDFSLNLLTFYLYFDSEFSSELLLLSNSIYNIFKNKSFYYSNINEILDSLSLNLIDKNEDNNLKIYFSNFHISGINIILSYKNFSNRFFNLVNLQSSIINSILDIFTNNTTHITFKFKPLYLTNIYSVNPDYSSNNNILLQLYDYYYYNFLRQCIKIIFSIDILGDPYNLINHLSLGIKDFITMPIYNVMNGPSEFIFNSINGTKSLISNFFGGILASFHKITSSLSKNILKLTNSEEYIKNKKKIILSNYNNNNIINIFKLISIGLKYGINDIFYFPYIYYKKKGIFEVPIGTLMGLISLFVKPISGIMDGISMIANNMSKNILYVGNSFDNNFIYDINNRIRYNRKLNKKNNKIEEYNKLHQMIEYFLNSNIDEFKYRIGTNDSIEIIKHFFYNDKNEDNKENKQNFIFLIFIRELKTKEIYLLIYYIITDKIGKIQLLIQRNKNNIKKEGSVTYVDIIKFSNIVNINNKDNTINIFYLNKNFKYKKSNKIFYLNDKGFLTLSLEINNYYIFNNLYLYLIGLKNKIFL